MIDARAARNAPDEFRRRLARKGATETFDAWLQADERWRSGVPRVDELRAKTKLKGKPTPEQLEELRGVKEELQHAEQELAEGTRVRFSASLASAEARNIRLSSRLLAVAQGIEGRVR